MEKPQKAAVRMVCNDSTADYNGLLMSMSEREPLLVVRLYVRLYGIYGWSFLVCKGTKYGVHEHFAYFEQ